jgi:patatin-like phospholipase/acyl hydrolase
MSQDHYGGAAPAPLHGAVSSLDTTGLCLLSLDGGGVRGLSTLYILKGLMTRLNDEREALQLPHVKPCEIFDLIGGTSTGGYA